MPKVGANWVLSPVLMIHSVQEHSLVQGKTGVEGGMDGSYSSTSNPSPSQPQKKGRDCIDFILFKTITLDMSYEKSGGLKVKL